MRTLPLHEFISNRNERKLITSTDHYYKVRKKAVICYSLIHNAVNDP